MPITKSAKKALRQSLRRKTQNTARKETFKNLIKEIKSLAAAGKTKEALAVLPKMQKALDKAAKTGAIKKNKAARLKSRLAKLIGKTKSS